VTLACGDCCRADCFVQKGARCVSLAFFEFHPALMGFFPTLLRDIHTQLCHTPSFTHNISHALFHTQLSHTTFTHIIFLCHTTSFIYDFVIYHFLSLSILHHILCLSFLPRPPYNICGSFLEEVDLWGHPVLLFFAPQ